MAEITDIANAIFRNREKWIEINNEDKEKWFFIFNRYFCKIYPDKAQLLNQKNIDKVMAMDIWYHFMGNEPYPNNFWSKTPKVDKSLTEKEFKTLKKHLNIKEEDVEYLINKFPDFIKEELNYLKKIEKEK